MQDWPDEKKKRVFEIIINLSLQKVEESWILIVETEY